MDPFPENFAWGVTWASVQAEGVAPTADWSAWERTGRAPKSNDGNGLRVDWRDDLRLLRSLGLNAVRIPVEWARIEPQPDKVDQLALDWYRDLIAEARDVGLAPWITLHSTSSPGWFSEDEKGFRDQQAVNRWWIRHVDRCAERFDELAAGWTPIDDPVGWAVRAFHLGNRPPGHSDPTELRDAVHGALAADHAAAQLLAQGGARTLAVRGVPTIAGVEPGAEAHAQWWRSLLFDSWVGALADGELAIPDVAPRLCEEWTEDFDFVGVSFDHPVGVDAEGRLTAWPADGRRADNGFVPLPEELGTLGHQLAERLPERRLVISANGVSTTDDEFREQLLEETLGVLANLISDGIALDGYFHDTGIDGYHWLGGFSTQRGLVDRDRNVKGSGALLRTALTA